jgi:hypothetical protein
VSGLLCRYEREATSTARMATVSAALFVKSARVAKRKVPASILECGRAMFVSPVVLESAASSNSARSGRRGSALAIAMRSRGLDVADREAAP